MKKKLPFFGNTAYDEQMESEHSPPAKPGLFLSGGRSVEKREIKRRLSH
jgi:hypothetical protein